MLHFFSQNFKGISLRAELRHTIENHYNLVNGGNFFLTQCINLKSFEMTLPTNKRFNLFVANILAAVARL